VDKRNTGHDKRHPPKEHPNLSHIAFSFSLDIPLSEMLQCLALELSRHPEIETDLTYEQLIVRKKK
jgi:hypothetical protein